MGLAEVPQATIHNVIRMLNEFSSRFVNDPASAAKVPRDVLNRAVQMLKELSQADAGDGFPQDIRELDRRSRSDYRNNELLPTNARL